MKTRYAIPWLMVAAALLFLAVSGAAAAQDLWVVSDGTRLQAEPTAASASVVRLPLDAKLTRLSTADKWYEVRTENGETGWVYRGKVSETKPGDEGGELDELLGDLGESDILLAAADTSRSVRGFMDEPESEGAPPIPEPYRSALDRVLTFYVGEAEVDAFLQEGGIGEYAP